MKNQSFYCLYYGGEELSQISPDQYDESKIIVSLNGSEIKISLPNGKECSFKPRSEYEEAYIVKLDYEDDFVVDKTVVKEIKLK